MKRFMKRLAKRSGNVWPLYCYQKYQLQRFTIEEVTMFNPGLMEKVGRGQQSDRLHEAEMAQLFKANKKSASKRFKLTLVTSGTGLTVLMIIQLVGI